VTGTGRDAARLELARTLGADQVVDVQKQAPLQRILELTGGEGVDAVLDCTAGAGVTPILLGIEALKRRGGTLVVQGELAAFPDFPLELLTTNTFGLDEVDRAIRTVGGEGDDGAIHVSLLPWKRDEG
jgi:threonine dehydrogenase-like Zn-dependent dehydrogenase